MSEGYSNRIWQCPFFRWDEKSKVHCEGGVVSLPKREYTDYIENYCAHITGWRGCPLARALNLYYERTG